MKIKTGFLKLAFLLLIASSTSNDLYALGKMQDDSLAVQVEKVKGLISYLEFALNTIGDSNTPPREKDIIITTSYSKFFRDEDVQVSVEEMRAAYTRRREIVVRVAGEYESPHLVLTPPKGAFYFFHDLRSLALPSVEICERILEEASVGLVPGSAFGKGGEGFVRMSIAASDEDVETGMRSILNWVNQQTGKK